MTMTDIRPLTSIPDKIVEDLEVFNARFYSCQKLLVFIAGRVLDRSEDINEAVHSCWITASRSAPRFEDEGAFRSWLLRVLIDEALLIRFGVTPRLLKP
jgi:DNA-directed RNA polymerase specialized sigma24 family protein